MELYKYVAAVIFCCSLRFASSTFMCKSTNNCLCTTVQSHYEYQCPMDDSSIVVKVWPTYGLFVQCLQEIDWDTQYFPSIELDNVNVTMFRACPLPKNIINVINKLGVNSTKELQFDFSSHSKESTLTSSYFDGLENIEKLILNDNEIGTIDQRAFQSLNKLTEIDLRSNTIQLLPGMFKYNTELRLLDLAQNELNYLPTNIFQNLSELRILYLWSNNLTLLDSAIFEDVAKLQTLELRNNHIQTLPEDIFYGLKNLKTVSLAMNDLRKIPETLFSGNADLVLIMLERNNYLADLPDRLFSNLTKLESVLLNDCKLKTLPEGLFSGSSRLQNISLEKNELERLPEKVFEGLGEMKMLNLSYNGIVDLPDDIFASMVELKVLNLKNNLLRSISDRLFLNLQKLEIMNLKSNRIAYIQSDAFVNVAKLKEIILSHNYLDLDDNETTVPPFQYNLDLERVDLSHNNISRISEDWMYSKVHLRKLDFSYNHITYLHFSYLVVVSDQLDINLSYNKIRIVNFTYAEIFADGQGNLDAFSYSGPNTVVHLNGNPIECDCNMYDFARYIERTIDPTVLTLVTVMADDLTCTGPINFVGFPVNKLKARMLTCPIEPQENFKCPENCTCVIRPWDKSFIVDCENANLTNVPEITLPKGNIFDHTEVNLRRNMLRSGPERSESYMNVTKLYLSWNKINEITWIPPKIQILHLSDNNINSLSYKMLLMMNVSSLTNLSLGRNPWNCDCSIKNLSIFLVSQLTTKQIDAKDIHCFETDKVLVNLNENEFCSTYTLVTISASLVLVILAFVAAIFTALFYRNELKIKVWLFAHDMCLWFVTEEEIDRDKLFDAFISYSHKDEDFVMNELLPVLEQGPRPYKLCLHIRDWIAGEFIPNQITKSVKSSRRTLVILSPNFLQSVWGKMEFRMAHTQAMTEGRARVVVILYGDVDLNNDLDDELKAYIKTNTYLKWGDSWFWDKLRYALPHSRIKLGRRSQRNQNIMISLNDKLDLINNIPTTPNPGSTPPAINMEPPLLLKHHPLNFKASETLTPPAEAGLNPLLVTVNM